MGDSGAWLGTTVHTGTVRREWIDFNNHMNVAYYLLAFDEKRIHQFQRMYHAEDGYLAATAEWLTLHVDLEKRRVAPWPKNILEGISRVAKGQPAWGIPEELGSTMAIRNPIWTMIDQETDTA